MQITELDASKGIATCRLVSDNATTAVFHRIDVSVSECSCGKWKQTGILCIHAYKYVSTHSHVAPNGIFNEQFFTPICFTDHWRMFYDHNTIVGILPGDEDVERVMSSQSQSHLIIAPRLTNKADDTQRITMKRIRGSNEQSTSGSIAPVGLKKKRQCKYCGNWLAKTTKHPPTACIQARNKKQKTEEQAQPETQPETQPEIQPETQTLASEHVPNEMQNPSRSLLGNVLSYFKTCL